MWQSLGKRVKELELVVQELDHRAGRSRWKSRPLLRLTCHYLYKVKQLQPGKWAKAPHPPPAYRADLEEQILFLFLHRNVFLPSFPTAPVKDLFPGCWLPWAGPIWKASVASWSGTAGTFLKLWDISLCRETTFVPSSNKEQVIEK